MGLKILVLAKQVPDTRNVGKDAMKPDGTVNRAILPAIFNPEDLNALEQALLLKDKYLGSEVIILTMGPPRAADIIREGMFRGADTGYLITDRRFAGADTLATSYVISKTANKLAPYDIIISGRQAIDGDTAQVGPQTAEKLNIPQVTYTEEILSVDLENKMIKIKRRLERGVEVVESPMPLLITVHSSAAKCRPRNARLLMKYKFALTESEKKGKDEEFINTVFTAGKDYLNLNEWNLDNYELSLEEVGLAGSPTKVKAIQNVVLQSKDSKVLTSSESDIKELMAELLDNHTLGS